MNSNDLTPLKGDVDTKLKDVMSTKEAAKFLGLHRQTVKYHYYQSKRIKGKLVGGQLLFHRKELEKFQKSKDEA